MPRSHKPRRRYVPKHHGIDDTAAFSAMRRAADQPTRTIHRMTGCNAAPPAAKSLTLTTMQRKTMRTYDTDARRLNVGAFWSNLRAVLRRWLDRERELVSLRNAVGMMSEARRADAAEWQDMHDLNREMRADALRLRWLTEDHTDPELRERVRSICQSIPTRSISGVRLDIDANMGG